MQTSRIEPDRKKRAFQAILEGETFARCDQLRSFLRHVGEMSISGRGREITEYPIAVGRLATRPGFPLPTIRPCEAARTSLRCKLQRNYASEDPDAAVRIELPKGCYVPPFLALADVHP